MTALLAGVVAIAFVTGLAVGTYRKAGNVVRLNEEARHAKDVARYEKRRAAKLEGKLARIRRANVERVRDQAESDHQMAEWLSRWDPEYRERAE